ncbi:zinc finger protein GLI4 isoform X1 [Vulpes lagopus]|uniref:zinc finger protein GLI4 isoform X1 n=1 Tax=Vulpes lagopus TaxID=494514 RepID=UPI001BC91BCC|nr:zinc finger protein GLI4 isoform X1 [Vulpes lagopus]
MRAPLRRDLPCSPRHPGCWPGPGIRSAEGSSAVRRPPRASAASPPRRRRRRLPAGTGPSSPHHPASPPPRPAALAALCCPPARLRAQGRQNRRAGRLRLRGRRARGCPAGHAPGTRGRREGCLGPRKEDSVLRKLAATAGRRQQPRDGEGRHRAAARGTWRWSPRPPARSWARPSGPAPPRPAPATEAGSSGAQTGPEVRAGGGAGRGRTSGRRAGGRLPLGRSQVCTPSAGLREDGDPGGWSGAPPCPLPCQSCITRDTWTPPRRGPASPARSSTRLGSRTRAGRVVSPPPPPRGRGGPGRGGPEDPSEEPAPWTQVWGPLWAGGQPGAARRPPAPGPGALPPAERPLAHDAARPRGLRGGGGARAGRGAGGRPGLGARGAAGGPAGREAAPLRGLRQELQVQVAAAQAPAHPHGREAVRVPRVREALPRLVGLHPAPPHPHGREALRVRPVRPRLQPQLALHAAPAHPQRREALQVRRVRPGLQPELQPGAAPAAAHGREAVRLQPVRQGLHLELRAHRAPAHPHRREALRVRRLRQGLPRPLALLPAPADAHGREALRLRRLRQGLRPELAAHPAPEGPLPGVAGGGPPPPAALPRRQPRAPRPNKCFFTDGNRGRPCLSLQRSGRPWVLTDPAEAWSPLTPLDAQPGVSRCRERGGQAGSGGGRPRQGAPPLPEPGEEWPRLGSCFQPLGTRRASASGQVQAAAARPWLRP